MFIPLNHRFGTSKPYTKVAQKKYQLFCTKTKPIDMVYVENPMEISSDNV